MTKKQSQDATLRNTRAANKRLTALERAVKQLARRVEKLEKNSR